MMYQPVTRKMRPKGKVRLLPWATITQVEALEVSGHLPNWTALRAVTCRGLP